MKNLERKTIVFPWLNSIMALGFLFLYLPIFTLIFYSFNESRLVTVWGGFSTKWYSHIWYDRELISAVKMSLKVGVSSATLSVAFGTLAGVALGRFGSFRGRTLYSGMLFSPLVMPDVIIGFSFLLLFVGMSQLIGWPETRGMITIILAHSTLGMAYVAVLIQARMMSFDRSLEEAALDLGAKPLKVFFVIILPLILPALISGWLLAFTLSLDDLIIASFTSGPGATTLPMLIYSRVRLGVNPEINALAAIIICVVSTIVVAAGALSLRVPMETTHFPKSQK